jgi:hypothetical protein
MKNDFGSYTLYNACSFSSLLRKKKFISLCLELIRVLVVSIYVYNFSAVEKKVCYEVKLLNLPSG